MLDIGTSRLREIASGSRAPHVLDLFSGCGGISLGFEQAGFKIVGGVESDPAAAMTHARMFHGAGSAAASAMDITQTDAAAVCDRLGLGKPDESIDVLVGGPPCQAFARVGRAKLREIAQHPKAFASDPRADLYLHYLEFVRDIRPLAIVIENVPDLLNHAGRNVAEEICAILDLELGYEARFTLLNASWYGVPQMRERCFILAFHRSLNIPAAFPEPTHFVELPRGYKLARQHALSRVGTRPLGYFAGLREPDPGLVPGVSAFNAIGDLPAITEHLFKKIPAGRRPMDVEVSYKIDFEEASDYAKKMRQNHRSGNSFVTSTKAHVTRLLPRDYRIFKAMDEGDEYPAAHECAKELFKDHLSRLEPALVPCSPAWKAERAKFVPPYDPGKFPNKWWKLRRDRPVRTLMAHISKDTYSHIHYDSDQARTITVREAARLQSFPDSFEFCGSMNAAFRQIGNAVPPLLAAAVARQVMYGLRSASAGTRSIAA